MKNTISILFLLLFSSLFLSAQDQKSYDIRLRAGVYTGVNELRFSPLFVQVQNPNVPPRFIFLSRNLGRSFKGQLEFSLVWKRRKDASLKESWGITMGYAYNRQEYLQTFPQDEFLSGIAFRYYNFLSIPVLLSRNIFWGSKDNRLELSAGPEISLLSGGVRGYRRFVSTDFLESSLRRADGIRFDLAFRALWKGQIFKKQDLDFGFGLNYGLQSVVDQEFQIYAVENPGVIPAIIPENVLYQVKAEVLPISYFLILQYDLSLTKRN